MFASVFMLVLVQLAAATDKRCTIYDGGCAFHVVMVGSECTPRENHYSNTYRYSPRLTSAAQTREGYEKKEEVDSVKEVSEDIKENLRTTIARMDDLESRLITVMEGISSRTLRQYRKIKHELEDVRNTLQTINRLSSTAGSRPPRSPKCPQGFETIGMWDSCYMLSKVNATFAEAEQFCSAYKSRLVSVEDVKEAYILDSLIESQKDFRHVDKWWTSAKYIPITKRWMWTSPDMVKPIFYTRWAPGEPNGRSTSHCMVIQVPNAFEWIDAMCLETHHFICEIENK